LIRLQSPRAARLVTVALALALASVACTTLGLRNYDAKLEKETTERAEAKKAGQDPAPIEARLVANARAARDEAQASAADPLTAVSFYRIAVVSAWQAGPAGESELTAIYDAGVATCERLPQQDASAPRDCTLIRLSLPYAVHDRARRQLDPIDARVEALPPGSALPATEGPAIQRLFGDLERQLVKVSDLRARAKTLAAPPELIASIDARRQQMFCSVTLAFRDLRAVQGNTLTTLKPVTQRKEVLRLSLKNDGLDTSCGQAAPASGPS
jgi:hypothetical protein